MKRTFFSFLFGLDKSEEFKRSIPELTLLQITFRLLIIAIAVILSLFAANLIGTIIVSITPFRFDQLSYSLFGQHSHTLSCCLQQLNVFFRIRKT